MSHRPYPDADRALRQLDRHAPPTTARQPTEAERYVQAVMWASLRSLAGALQRMPTSEAHAG